MVSPAGPLWLHFRKEPLTHIDTSLLVRSWSTFQGKILEGKEIRGEPAKVFAQSTRFSCAALWRVWGPARCRCGVTSMGVFSVINASEHQKQTHKRVGK